MRFFRLILNNTLRHKLRTVLTIVAVAIALLAFGFIRTAISAWYLGVTASAPDRLITRSKISITFTLPLAQKERIERIPGVVAVTHGTWFGGIYKDPGNFFPQFAMENVESFQLYPEFLIDTSALRAFATERNAVIVGVKTMERFGWKMGDVVHLTGTIYPGDWDFVIRGVYTGRSEATDVSQFIFNWDYIEQRMQRDWPTRTGQVGWWVIKIDDPAKAASISTAVDREFDNSADETITETEAAFQQSFVAMSGTIILSLQIVS
ncbi:MAG: ABC transporter permease, partial [candidate division Zixibacteria bacterium]|nr:ABC transporter permease [candidate division Zixibacteria bacterium]